MSSSSERRLLNKMALRYFRTLTVLLLAACLSQCAVETADEPNILLITIDTLRADHLGVYGYDRPTSPNIDRIAAEGMVFDAAYCPRGLTWPSLTTMMTSLYPVEHGIWINGVIVSHRFPQLAEQYKKRGYATAAFMAHPTLQDQSWKGFDVVEEGETTLNVTENEDDRIITEKALAWLEKHKDEKFFLWLHYYSPHTPYEPPEGFGNRFDPDYEGPITGNDYTLDGYSLRPEEHTEADLRQIIALYDEEITYTDAQIGRLWDGFGEHGLQDDLLTIIVGDHGEELADHHDYLFHLGSLYNGTLRIPLIFRWPEHIPAGTRNDTVIENIDIGPTMLAMFGARAPKEFRGDDFSPVFEGKEVETTAAYAEFEDKIRSIRTKEYSYHYNPTDHQILWISPERQGDQKGDSYVPVETEELYDLRADPLEQNNIAAERPEVVKELRAQLEAWSEKHGWKLNTRSAPELSDEIRQQFEALGYLGATEDKPADN